MHIYKELLIYFIYSTIVFKDFVTEMGWGHQMNFVLKAYQIK
jgi:hypothetical protein